MEIVTQGVAVLKTCELSLLNVNGFIVVLELGQHLA